MKIVHVLGARRNSLKVAPVMRELARRDGIIQILAASMRRPHTWECFA